MLRAVRRLAALCLGVLAACHPPDALDDPDLARPRRVRCSRPTPPRPSTSASAMPAPLAITARRRGAVPAHAAARLRRRPLRARPEDGIVKTLATVARSARHAGRGRAPDRTPRRRAASVRAPPRAAWSTSTSRTTAATVLVPLGGKLFHLIDRTTGARTHDRSRAAPPYDPHLSPDGTRDRVRARRRSLASIAAGAPARRLTQHPEGFEYGDRRVRRAGGARAARAASGGRPTASSSRSSARDRGRSTRSTSPTRATPTSRRCRSSTRAPAPRTRSSTSAWCRSTAAASRRWLTWDGKYDVPRVGHVVGATRR